MVTNNQSKKLTVDLPSDTTIVLSREFAAPRPLVYDAFSKPEHIPHWWGMQGSTMAVCEVDFRPGGTWRFVEHTADGNDYGFHGEYREVVPPERIVWTFEYEGEPSGLSVETMEFQDLERSTRVVSTSVFATTEARDAMLQSGMEQGAGESYDRLDEYLRTLQ